ncbi:MAG: peptidoglycan-binding domain-containing protein [Pseudomonadota bacterium]
MQLLDLGLLGKKFCIFVVASLLLVGLASAQNSQRLLYVQKIDLEVLFDGKKGKWCGKRLDLKLVSSQPLNYQQPDFKEKKLSNLVGKLGAKCATLEEVGVVAFARSEPGLVIFEGSFLRSDAWKFSDLKLPDAQKIETAQNDQQPAIQNRDLSRAEARELQQRLSFLGYPVGKIDGKPGRKTAKAIREFLRDRGQSLPARPDLAILSEVRRASGVPAKDDYQRSTAQTETPKATLEFVDSKQPGLSRDLSLRVLHHIPDALEQGKDILRWLEVDAKAGTSAPGTNAGALLSKYNSGTTFDKQDVLRSYRQALLQESRADRFAKPYAFKLRYPARISGNYVNGKGFPVTYGGNYRGSEFRYDYDDDKNEAIDIWLPRFRDNLYLRSQVSTHVSYVPILDENKARIMARLLQNKNNQFEARIFFAADPQIKPAGYGNFASTGIASELSLVMFGNRELTGKPKRVFKWQFPTGNTKVEERIGASEGGLNAVQFARLARISTKRDHLNLNSGLKLDIRNPLIGLEKSGENPFRRPSRSYSDVNSGWAHFLNLTRLQRDPSIVQDERIHREYLRVYLNEQDKAALTKGKNFFNYRGGYSDRDFNEFEYRAFLNEMNSGGHINKVKRFFPVFPIPVMNTRTVYLGNYDFDNQQYPILFKSGSGSFEQPQFKPVLPSVEPSEFNLQRYPKILPLDFEKARFLAELLQSNNGQRKAVFLGIFSELISEKDEAGNVRPGRYDAEVKRVALYLDEKLTKKVYEFPLGPLIEVDQEPTEPEPTVAELKLSEVIAIQSVPKNQIVLAVDSLAGGAGFLDEYVKSSREFRDANELDQDDVFNQLKDQVLSLGQAPKSFWLTGVIGLGKYDLSTRKFQVKNLSLSATNQSQVYFNADLEFGINNWNDLSGIAADEALARRMLEEVKRRGSDRTFDIRAKVRPVSATYSGEGYYADAKVQYHVEELFVFGGTIRGENEPDYLIAHLTPGSPRKLLSDEAANIVAGQAAETDSGTNSNELPDLLTQDLVFAHLLSGFDGTLSNQSLDWLIANRWLYENRIATSVGPRFLNKGARISGIEQVEELREKILPWYRNLALKMPEKLKLAWLFEKPSWPENTPYSVSAIQNPCNFAGYGLYADLMPERPNDADYRQFLEVQRQEISDGTDQEFSVLNDVPMVFWRNSAINCNSDEADWFMENILDEDNKAWWPRVQLVMDRMPVPLTYRVPEESGNGAILEFSVTGIEVIPNGNDVPHVRINGRFEKMDVAVFNEDGQAIGPSPKVTRSINRQQTEPEDHFGGSQPDILGVQIGQSLEEADKLLKEHFANARVMDSVVKPSPATPPMQYARMYVSADGNELVKLFYEPVSESKQILAISRDVRNPGLSDADLLASGKQKFGEPGHAQPSSYGSAWAWGDNIDESRCRPDRSGSGATLWRDQSGQQFEVYNILDWMNGGRDLGLGNSPKIENYSDDQIEFQYRKCGTSVQLQRFSWGFYNSIVDIDQYLASYLASKKMVLEGIESEVQTEQQKPKVKL